MLDLNAYGRLHLRRSVSANVLSGDHVQVERRPASAVTPISRPASSPRVVEPTRTRPRTRYYVSQEAALLAASRDIASSSRAVLGNRAPEQSTPVAEPTALADELSILLNEDIDFHSPASSTIEVSAPVSVTLQTPLTPSLYGVAQTQGRAPSTPAAASLPLGISTSATCSEMPQNVAVTRELAHTSPYTSASQQIPNPHSTFIAAGNRQLMAPLPSLFSVRSHSTSTAPLQLASAPMPPPSISSAAMKTYDILHAPSACSQMSPVTNSDHMPLGSNVPSSIRIQPLIGASSLPYQYLLQRSAMLVMLFMLSINPLLNPLVRKHRCYKP
jgi:hypothetical protein